MSHHFYLQSAAGNKEFHRKIIMKVIGIIEDIYSLYITKACGTSVRISYLVILGQFSAYNMQIFVLQLLFTVCTVYTYVGVYISDTVGSQHTVHRHALYCMYVCAYTYILF